MAGATHALKMSAITLFFIEEPRLIRRGEDAVEAGHIKNITVVAEHLLIKGEVWASMRNVTYKVEISLEDDMAIKEASCTCPRGQYMCHHMAALCIYAHYETSSTQFQCTWSRRRPTGEQTPSVSEMYPLPKEKVNFMPLLRKPNKEDADFYYNKIKEYGAPVGFEFILKPEVNVQESIVPDINDVLFSDDYLAASDQKAFLVSKLAVTHEVIIEVANATVGQASNSKWLLARKNRLTASKFGHILNAVKRNSYPKSLFHTLSEARNLDGIKAIVWGRNNEKEAINWFNNKTNKEVVPSGLWLHPCGFLGASPDGLIQQEEAIVEIKCPYKWRKCISLEEEIRKSKDYVVFYDGNKMEVNKNHTYYHQVQGQLHITNKQLCYLIIWTPLDSLVIEIHVDANWSSNIDLLQNFFMNKYINYILGVL